MSPLMEQLKRALLEVDHLDRPVVVIRLNPDTVVMPLEPERRD